ncbi:hypothetical protein ABZV61_42615, partial [Streptomyces sp900116325]
AKPAPHTSPDSNSPPDDKITPSGLRISQRSPEGRGSPCPGVGDRTKHRAAEARPADAHLDRQGDATAAEKSTQVDSAIELPA